MKFLPHDYQKYAIEYIKSHPITALFLDMGLGKTVTTLTAIRDLMYDTFKVRRVLVVAPLRVARDTWPEEIRKWDHLKDLTYSVVVGIVAERRRAWCGYRDKQQCAESRKRGNWQPCDHFLLQWSQRCDGRCGNWKQRPYE